MARSTYVYVVMDKAGMLPEATFTVKYEMKRWLKQAGCEPADTEVYRFPDGGDGTISKMAAKDVFEI